MELHAAGDGRHDWLVSRPRAWFAFALSFLLMMVDFIDRQIVVSMFPFMKAEWGVSDRQLGALVSLVSVTVALGALPTALLVDRWGRVRGVVLMATLWSLATIACGLAQSYRQLLGARAFIGLGEAGYGPAGGAILASIFPSRMRATIVGSFLAAASFGSVLGVVLGGAIAARWNWHAAFGVVGVPGLVLALLYMGVADYEAPRLAPASASKQAKALATLRELFRARAGVTAYFAGAMQLITVSTLLAWLPSYFNRVYGQPGTKAGIWAAGMIVCATAGAIFWSWVTDRLARGDLRMRMLVPAMCCLGSLAALSAAFAALNRGDAQLGLIALGAFMSTCVVGAVPAVALDVVHPSLRATAGSMVTVVQNLFGLGIGPLLTGALSDAFGLTTALAIVPATGAIAAVLLLYGARFYPAERAAVAHIEVRRLAPDAAPRAA